MEGPPSLAANRRSGNQRPKAASFQALCQDAGSLGTSAGSASLAPAGITIELPSVVCSTLPSELPGQWAAPARAGGCSARGPWQWCSSGTLGVCRRSAASESCSVPSCGQQACAAPNSAAHLDESGQPVYDARNFRWGCRWPGACCRGGAGSGGSARVLGSWLHARHLRLRRPWALAWLSSCCSMVACSCRAAGPPGTLRVHTEWLPPTTAAACPASGQHKQPANAGL